MTLDQIDEWEVSGPDWSDTLNPPNWQNTSIKADSEINKLVSIWLYGDSAVLKVDAIVNRTNSTLSAGGIIFQSIKNLAGPHLLEELERIGRCEESQTIVTSGYDLPAKYIIHTAGPDGEESHELEVIMDSILSHIDGTNIRSIGIGPFFIENNGFTLFQGCSVVMKKTREFLDKRENRAKVDRIVFIVMQQRNFSVFANLMYLYFPIEGLETHGIILQVGALDVDYDEEEGEEEGSDELKIQEGSSDPDDSQQDFSVDSLFL